jgi:hypothetical protein
MRDDFGSTNVAAAGTAVQVNNVPFKVFAVAFQAPDVNAGKIYIGKSDVSATNGWYLAPGDTLELEFGDGSVKMDQYYVDAANNGDDVNWYALFET